MSQLFLGRIRRFENLHIVLWLLKDTCWVLDWKTGGMLMILPTISMALWITWMSRSITSELLHNLAVCCWISANSVWMTGEFFYEDTLRPIATVFFVLGLLIVATYYAFPSLRKKSLVSAREPNESIHSDSFVRKK